MHVTDACRGRGSVGRWLADNRRAVPIVLSFVATNASQKCARSSCRCPQVSFARNSRMHSSNILQRFWWISIGARYMRLSIIDPDILILFLLCLISHRLLWMNDWCVIVVRFLRFHFVFFSQKEKERGDKQGIESTSIMCKRRMQMIASERKRSDILSIQNARERIALLILMRSSRHGPFRDFFERFTLCVGGGRKGESVGPKPRKEYQF